MSYVRECRTCGVALGSRLYENHGTLACRECAVKHDPGRVAAYDVQNSAQEAAAGAARPGEAVAALAAIIGNPSIGWTSGAGPSGSQVEKLASMLDGGPEATAKGSAKGGDPVAALASMMN